MASVGTIKYKNGSSWIDILHPVNSFYFSYASTSPSSLFGGTWTRITGAVIRGNTSVGYIGADTHTLTIAEMPRHNHLMGDFWHTASGGNVQNGTYYGIRHEDFWTDYSGGGQHTQSCNAPSTVISGIVLRKPKRVVVM